MAPSLGLGGKPTTLVASQDAAHQGLGICRLHHVTHHAHAGDARPGKGLDVSGRDVADGQDRYA